MLLAGCFASASVIILARAVLVDGFATVLSFGKYGPDNAVGSRTLTHRNPPSGLGRNASSVDPNLYRRKAAGLIEKLSKILEKIRPREATALPKLIDVRQMYPVPTLNTVAHNKVASGYGGENTKSGGVSALKSKLLAKLTVFAPLSRPRVG
ncbi:hypothetical protein RvY_19122 [Ramazzottius varieornatus]|uniref:Uncharacterized protein n=1 Tax=Ramazzottius varieornatus TaxID=947166 RepID=A0A1D1W8D5_RAMVA|nr:hypothetical protein RvY_19122 [Ramazzottius varieornatus]